MSMSSTREKPHHHRSSLKQHNKPFKGSARSRSRGRVERKKRSIPSTMVMDLCKADRKNRSTLLQQKRRNQVAASRRIYSGQSGMPRIIVVVPVSSSVDLTKVLPFMGTSDGLFYSERNKQNLHVIKVSREAHSQAEWTMAVIDAAQVADCIVLAASAVESDLDDFGRDALAVIRSVGVSSAAAVVQKLGSHKHSHEMRMTWLAQLQAELSSVTKVYCADSMFSGDECREALEMERLICQQHLSGISWRDMRPYLLTDNVEIIQGEGEHHCTVKVTGFIRGGKSFSANRLIHIPLLGETLIVSRIELLSKPDQKQNTTNENSMKIEENYPIIQQQIRNEQEAESPEAESHGDPFSAEAMMLAAEKMDMELDSSLEFSSNEKRMLKVVPKGTSSYQATWLDEETVEAAEDPLEEIKLDEDSNSAESIADQQMDIYEHETRLAEHKELQFNERHFPDEIELDQNVSARARLQKYRGVQSLRTSTWDPNENLPIEYGRIFKLADIRHSRKTALEENDSPFVVGQKVALYIEGVSQENFPTLERAGKNIAVFGLLKHEQRLTVVNFTVTRSKTFDGVLHNKEELVAIMGGRKFIINPIWSEHSTTNLHKLLRQVDSEIQGAFVGTVYAPVAFSPCPVILFKQENQTLKLVGNGCILDLDPQRIVLKRVTLTGCPFKVHKRTVVVRFMFNNPADVAWFRPVELISRLGARGHIRESLGTHGYMKCLFERVIFQHDTVAMHLYKRSFPKWTTRPYHHHTCSLL